MKIVRIGLIGARGSGKSDLCDEILGHLPLPRGMADGYVEGFQLKTDLATAQYATYIVNMAIAMFRMDMELEEIRDLHIDGEAAGIETGHLITCGTMLDTTIYLALNASALANTGEGSMDINLMNDVRSLATMHWFGMMRVDAWPYDHVFYLPLGDKRDEEQDLVAAVFDDHVVEACEAFQIPFVTLDQPTVEEKAQAALKVINSEETNGSTTS